MDFFQQFSKTYNKIFEKNKFVNVIPPTDEEWEIFSRKISEYSLEQREYIYLSIIHYHFLQDKITMELPYNLKLKEGELLITYANLPNPLQHLILNLWV